MNHTTEELIAIGKEHKVPNVDKFVQYVKTRGFTRKDHYVHEWAERFALGIEYERSDAQGKRILDKLNE